MKCALNDDGTAENSLSIVKLLDFKAARAMAASFISTAERRKSAMRRGKVKECDYD